jgi:phosphatidylserine/phosphatidylglycerophosphate/cardiolipin synthase-like enzyme
MKQAVFHRLSDHEIKAVEDALRSGRLVAPFPAATCQAYVASEHAAALGVALEELGRDGVGPAQVATLLGMLAADRRARPEPGVVVDLVASGPEAPGVPSRDTSVVVRELFRHAQQSVLVVGYVVYQGRHVFRALADRMRAHPELRVRLCLDVSRPVGDTSLDSEILQRFAARFRTQEWPGDRVPEIYYDPRALERDLGRRATLHAKCIVVDRAQAFLSSANFTEAAQGRNIELGVLVHSGLLAARLADHFEGLVAAGVLRPLPGA